MLFNVSSLFSTGVALYTFAVRMVSVSWVPPYYIYIGNAAFILFFLNAVFLWSSLFFLNAVSSEYSFSEYSFFWIQFSEYRFFCSFSFFRAARYVFRSYMSLAASVVMGAGSALRRCLYEIHGCFLNPKRLFLNPRRFFATPEGCFATQTAVLQIKMVDLQTSKGCYANPFITRSAICSGVMLLRHA